MFPVRQWLRENKWAVMGAILMGLASECFQVHGRIEQAAADAWQNAMEKVEDK